MNVEVHAAPSAAVKFVAEDRVAYVGHMAADLMGAPGVQLNLQQTHLPPMNGPEVGNSRLPVVSYNAHQGRVPDAYGCIHRPRRRHFPIHQGQVAFVFRAVLLEDAVGIGIFRHHQSPVVSLSSRPSMRTFRFKPFD